MLKKVCHRMVGRDRGLKEGGGALRQKRSHTYEAS